ncbi:Spherulation-specific family 4 domain containing protein [Rhypophila sp. PSN 637]
MALLLCFISFAVSFPSVLSQDLRNDGVSAPLSKRAITQQIALASYIHPGSDPAAWTRLIGYPKQKISIVIANVLNGPESTVDSTWKTVIYQAYASNKTVLGYVRTGYLGRGGANFKTRLGSGEIADWTAQIEPDVDIWYELYGSSMGAIVFDEGWWECGTSNAFSEVYKHINRYTKIRHPGAVTVLNPGCPVGQCYESTMDTLVTFENTYQVYNSSFQGLTWTPSDPRKIWHIVHGTPASAVANAVSLSNARGAGFIHLTDDTWDNPYDTLPGDTYMQAQMNAVAGGVPLNAPSATWAAGSAAGTLPSLANPKRDYSSARLTWNAATNALGNNIYIKSFKGSANFHIASTPSTMRNIIIVTLPAGTTLTFFIRAIGGGGALGTASANLNVTTLSFPSGKSITNLTALPPSTNSTTYKADVLVPYGFLRLFLRDPVTGNGSYTCTNGWAMQFPPDNKVVCAKYMVEGSNLYRYTGVMPPDNTGMPWSWEWVGPVTVTPPVGGSSKPYTYTWTVPVGSSVMDTTRFVVQGERLGPYVNVFQPLPVLPTTLVSGV